MPEMPDISPVAALMADATRSRMLLLLLGGQALTAGELARGANVSPQAASNHLSQLLAGGLVRVAAQGRHRYYALSGPEVAQVLEALAALETYPARKITPRVPPDLQFARCCYDHLAGALGVQLLGGLLERGYLHADMTLTDTGTDWFTDFGLDVTALQRQKRPLTRPCLDWSERRPHLGGALGAALLTHLLGLGWLARAEGRSLRLTVAGAAALEQELGLKLGTQRAS